MPEPALTRPVVSAVELLPAIVLAFTAVYLLLPDSPAAARGRFRIAAGAAGILAVCAGAWQLWQPAAWWPASTILAKFATPRELLLAAGSLLAVLAAATALLARQLPHAQRAIAAVLFAVAVLLLLAGAPVPALLLVTGGAGWWMFGAGKPGAGEAKPLEFRISHEPLLACLTGGLLTLLLLAVVDRALVMEGHPALGGTRSGRLPSRAQITTARQANEPAGRQERSPADSEFRAFRQAARDEQPLVWGLLAVGGLVLLHGGRGAVDGEPQ